MIIPEQEILMPVQGGGGGGPGYPVILDSFLDTRVRPVVFLCPY